MQTHFRKLGATEGESFHTKDMAMAMHLQCGETRKVCRKSLAIDFHVYLHLFVTKCESGTLLSVVLMS